MEKQAFKVQICIKLNFFPPLSYALHVWIYSNQK